MSVHSDFKSRVVAGFEPLRQRAAGTMPTRATLSQSLGRLLDKYPKAATVTVHRDVATAFTTAAIDMWSRSIHSFLVSCALTSSSPIWSSTAGYYSSHYSVRALAHLLGYFQLFQKRRIIRLDLPGGAYKCDVEHKKATDHEHQFYWEAVRKSPQFSSDPLFVLKHSDPDISDVGHRNFANYADHVGHVGTFAPLDAAAVRTRVLQISAIRFDAPPIPRSTRFPDLESVQVTAYHRFVRFRQLVDEVVGTGNRFWRVHRTPNWTSSFVNFQLTESGGVGSLSN